MKDLKVFTINPLILAAAIVCSAFFASAEILIAWTMGTLFNNSTQIILHLGLLATALIIQTISQYGADILFTKFAIFVQSYLRKIAGRALLHMSVSLAGQQRIGDMLNRVNTETESIYNFLSHDFANYIHRGISLIFGVVFLITIHWQLAIFVIIGSVIVVIITLILNKRIEIAHRKWRTSEADMDVVAQDITAGQFDIKATGIETGILNRFDNVLQYWMKTFLHRNAVRSWNRGTALLFMVIVYIGVPAFSVGLVINEVLTIGMVLASIQAAKMISEPMQSFEFLISTASTIRVSFDRIRELIDIPNERTDGMKHTIISEAPIIDFSSVSFSYTDNLVLNNFSMSIGKGKIVALVGESGSGKSTVLRLVGGLYDIGEGELCFGGYSISTWNLNALRKNLSFVQQDSYFYPGSIKDNLLCGEDYSDEQLKEVIDKVQLTSWIDMQKDGLDTEVGEQGAILSGGLKQRMSIARALLKNPEILLLDEPTSALDEQTECEIMNLLREASSDLTCLIVSHRLSSVAYADEIYTMQDGKILEHGTHEELLSKKGYYNYLYTIQKKEGAR